MTTEMAPVDGAADERSHVGLGALLRGAMSAAALPHKLRLLNIEANHRLAQYQSHYNPNQPRVPAGHPDGGQWTRGGANSGIRLAAGEKPGLGALLAAILHVGLVAIEAYRSREHPLDLFQKRFGGGTVAWTEFKGKNIFGSNSTSPTYWSVDRAEADRLRATMIRRYPDVVSQDNVGQIPNDAFYHAETSVLLRSAKENGGTLAGQSLVVVVDRPMCPSCQKVLPYVGLELGNPTVTFIDSNGKALTMRDGAWVK
jgi:hypothetical protein